MTDCSSQCFEGLHATFCVAISIAKLETVHSMIQFKQCSGTLTQYSAMLRESVLTWTHMDALLGMSGGLIVPFESGHAAGCYKEPILDAIGS
jgi:hypothetical protein